MMCLPSNTLPGLPCEAQTHALAIGPLPSPIMFTSANLAVNSSEVIPRASQMPRICKIAQSFPQFSYRATTYQHGGNHRTKAFFSLSVF